MEIINNNIKWILLFALVLVFCIVPDSKVEIIGSFFEKVLRPISLPLSIIIGANLGILKYKQLKNKDKL